VVVRPGGIDVVSSTIGALPVVNAVLDRLGFFDLLSSHLPEPDARVLVDPAVVLGVVVRNLCVGRQPLYGLSTWAAGQVPWLLGLEPEEVGLLNDDRVGRALDVLFSADRSSLTTALSLAAVRSYGIDCSELHNDSTSITLYGAYRNATGEAREAYALHALHEVTRRTTATI
jgi:Domain of unknown function (DUF4277)